MKFKNKSQIIDEFQKLISVKITFSTDFIKKKEPAEKFDFHLKYEIYRNLLSRILKQSRNNSAKISNNYFSSVAKNTNQSTFINSFVI